MELTEEINELSWDIVGLSEVRRKGTYSITLYNGTVLFINGNGDTGGTGFLVNKSLKNKVIKFKTYSHRVSKLILHLNFHNKPLKVKIVQIYAPTSAASAEDMLQFYDPLECALEEDRSKYTIIMGDWNAKVGQKTSMSENSVGKHGYDSRNTRGEQLVEFCEARKLFIMNTFFAKPDEKKWTWLSPDSRTKNEIDLFISDSKHIFLDVEANNEIVTGSDHRPIRATIKLNLPLKKTKSKANKTKKFAHQVPLTNPALYENILEHKLAQETMEENINIRNDQIVSALNTTSKELTSSCPLQKPTNDQFQISKDIKKLFEKRRRLKRSGRDKIEFTVISRLIRTKLKELSLRKKIEALNEALQEGTSLKRVIRNQNIGTSRIISIKDGEKIYTEKKNILNSICSFYRELYKRAHNISLNELPSSSPEVLPILVEEVVLAISNLKRNKAAGPDFIFNEELRAGGVTLAKALCELFNDCLKQGRVPQEWLKAKLILLFKKGDRNDIRNYRPLSLLSNIYKVFMSVITRRMSTKLEAALPIEQTGFKKNFSTADNILVIQRLIWCARVYDFSFSLLFIDYEKAFDSVHTDVILKSLIKAGIESEYVTLLSYIYDNSELIINIDNMEDTVDVRRGLKQGDVPSAKFFCLSQEQPYENLHWNDYGINVNGTNLNVLKFADDKVLIGKNLKEVQLMLTQLVKEGEQIGLKINCNKTKLMQFGRRELGKVTLNGREIEEVDEFVYLGQLLSKKNQHQELSRRIGLAWGTFNKFRYLFSSSVDLSSKVRLWNSCILPVMIYGAETWSLNAQVMKKLQVAFRSMLRVMIGVRRSDKKTNRWLLQETGLEDISAAVTRRKWRWAGHIIRTSDGRWSKRILEWHPREVSRKRGRPTFGWDEEFRTLCGEATWHRVAQERSEWNRMTEVQVKKWQI